VLEAVQPTVDPTSYDMALILDMKAKLLGQKEQFEKAIEAWETVLRLSEAKNYFEQKATLEITLYLAQFCYQVGVTSKVPVVQRQYTEKASSYFKKWLAATPKPPADISMFYASILYNQAVVDPKHVDNNLLKQARAEVEKGIANSIHPKEGFYVLLLAILQQENDSVKAAETLELLVKSYPQKKDYWPSLWATYLNMASEAGNGDNRDETKSRVNYIRAINTMERAQALGLMKTPKENLTLVNLYLTAGQYGRATDLLYAGLKNGSIESDQKNWATLGYFYQQANEENKAIGALKEAASLFPRTGAFNLQIGQIYLSMEKTKDARDAFREAIKRGGLDKPYAALQALAYACFELEDFDEALEAVKSAEAFPEMKNDTQLPRLKFAIEASIKEREAAKAEMQKKAL
jgi:tetratricopeptide (TPR) repeat protein